MRLFVATSLPEEIKESIAMLRGGIPDARWISAENAHVTLAFIGEVQGHQIADISLALGRIKHPAFEVAIEGLGVFSSNKKPRILWAGVKPQKTLTLLHQKIVTAIESAGTTVDDRRFHPHITLARVHKSPYERVRNYLTTMRCSARRRLPSKILRYIPAILPQQERFTKKKSALIWHRTMSHKNVIACGFSQNLM